MATPPTGSSPSLPSQAPSSPSLPSPVSSLAPGSPVAGAGVGVFSPADRLQRRAFIINPDRIAVRQLFPQMTEEQRALADLIDQADILANLALRRASSASSAPGAAQGHVALQLSSVGEDAAREAARIEANRRVFCTAMRFLKKGSTLEKIQLAGLSAQHIAFLAGWSISVRESFAALESSAGGGKVWYDRKERKEEAEVLQREKTHLDTMVAQRGRASDHLISQIQDFENDISSINEKISEQNVKNKYLSSDLSTYSKNRLSIPQELIEKVKADLSSSEPVDRTVLENLAIADLRKQVDEGLENINVLRESLQAKETQSSALEQELDGIEDEKRDLARKIEQQNIEIKSHPEASNFMAAMEGTACALTLGAAVSALAKQCFGSASAFGSSFVSFCLFSRKFAHDWRICTKLQEELEIAIHDSGMTSEMSKICKKIENVDKKLEKLNRKDGALKKELRELISEIANASQDGQDTGALDRRRAKIVKEQAELISQKTNLEDEKQGLEVNRTELERTRKNHHANRFDRIDELLQKPDEEVSPEKKQELRLEKERTLKIVKEYPTKIACTRIMYALDAATVGVAFLAALDSLGLVVSNKSIAAKAPDCQVFEDVPNPAHQEHLDIMDDRKEQLAENASLTFPPLKEPERTIEELRNATNFEEWLANTGTGLSSAESYLVLLQNAITTINFLSDWGLLELCLGKSREAAAEAPPSPTAGTP